MTTSCIVHGAVWPDAPFLKRLRERLVEAFPDAQLLEAREPAAAPLGAAAAINHAAAQATGDVLVILEPWVTPEVSRLTRLRERAASGLAIEAHADGRPHLEPPAALPDDLLAELATASVTAPPPRRRGQRAAAWAIARHLFTSAGGLDARLGSIGYLDDLVARLGPDVALVSSEPIEVSQSPADTRTAWPLDEPVEQFLRARNRLITAFKTLDVDTAGVELARVAAEQILLAWRRSGWHAEDFRFGGDWGRRDTWMTRLLQPGRHGAARIADQEGVLAPLLALDAFLDETPALLVERQHRPQLASAPQIASPVQGLTLTSPDRSAGPATSVDAALDGTTTPLVSVIVVNWNGREHLEPCFRSLLESDYPADRLELVLVDNGSTDGSIELLRSTFPTVRIVALTSNLGFTGGNEAGVAASRGDVLVFFNNDMRVATDAISRLVAALDGGRACVAARVLSWDGERIDFLRGSLSFEGRGFQESYGSPANEARQTSADTFFANGGAFAVSRDAYTRAGGFDASLFAYYDDVDLGWRLRLTGTSIRVEDAAIAWHRHGATGRTQPAGQKKFLMERNALTVLARCYGEPALRRTLGATLLLAVRRTLDETTFGSGSSTLAALAPWSRRIRGRFRETAANTSMARSNGEAEAPPYAHASRRRVLRGFAAESFAALGAALEDLPRLAASRAQAQQARRTPDDEVLGHFGRTFDSLSSTGSYQPVHKALVDGLALPRLFNARPRLLIISHEAIAANMSGPAVRFLELGRALSTVARVTVAMPGDPAVRDDRCTIAGFDPATPSTLQRLAEDSDILFVQGFALVQYPFLTRLLLPIVVDLYCPFTIEHLEQTRGDARRAQNAPDILAVQNAQLDAGDFFICASEAQRDFWIGNLHSRGRINPLTYADDPTARRLIDVVPFGLPDERIGDAVERARAAAIERGESAGAVMKGVRPGIGVDDKVLLWAGSLLDWQDPLTLIRAVATLATRRSDVKLFFMGTKHPNPLITPMRIVDACRTLARELGVLDRHVFFNDWVPYDQRSRYLVEADLGVSTHREHLETHFSFRTRMLDYVWAGLPIVCTRGDVFGDLVASRGLGISVPPGEVDRLAEAIESMLSDGDRHARASAALRQLATEMRWSQVAAPLEAFCREPRHAPDHAPHLVELRQRLERKFKVSRWLKRTALRAGVTEMRVEQLKRLKAVQSLMVLRNRVAIARARR